MTESQFMQVIQQIDGKLDDIRDKLQEALIMTSGTQIKQIAQEKEIESLKIEVKALKTAYDRASGVYWLLSIPGVLGAIYAGIKMFSGN